MYYNDIFKNAIKYKSISPINRLIQSTSYAYIVYHKNVK